MKKEWDNSAIVAARAMPATARVPAELHIGNVRIAPATVLATMAGVTDTVFRRFIKNASLYTAPTNPGAPCLDSETWEPFAAAQTRPRSDAKIHLMPPPIEPGKAMPCG